VAAPPATRSSSRASPSTPRPSSPNPTCRPSRSVSRPRSRSRRPGRT
jgi:hypothetical protein